MKSIRLFFLCIAFITGTISGYNVCYPIAYGCIALALLLVITVYLAKQRTALTYALLPWPCIGAIYLCTLTAGAAHMGFNVKQNQIPVPKVSYCKFQLLGSGVPTSSGNLKCAALLKGVYDGTVFKPAGNKIQVIILKPTNTHYYLPGEYYVAPAKFRRVDPPRNPYQLDYRQVMARQGIYESLVVPESTLLPVLSNTFFERAKLWPYRLHVQVTNYFKAAYTSRSAQVLNALVAGENHVDAEVRQTFQNTGTIHALSVSGMHVTMFAALVFFVLSPLRRLKKGELLLFVCVSIVLGVYALFTGLSPSVLRAVLMLLLYMATRLLKLKVQPINIISLACLIQLIANPYYIYNVGFQLSYLAVTGIALFYPLLGRRIKINNKPLRAIVSLMALSISAQVLTTPYAAFLFHTVPLLALPANLLIQLPLVGVMYGGFLSAIVHLPWLVFVVEKACWVLLALLGYLSRLEGAALTNVTITGLQCLLATVFAALILTLAAPGYLKLKTQSAVVILSLIFVTGLINQRPTANSVVFFSTPQGYCVYVPHQKHPLLLTDLRQGTSIFNNNIEPYLKKCEVTPAHLPYNSQGEHAAFSFARNQLLMANKLFLVIDSTFTRNTHPFKMDAFDYAWVKHSNYYIINNGLTPRAVILDGTNSYTCLQAYTKYCTEKRVPLINIKTGMYFTI